jgi:hypothetical protein
VQVKKFKIIARDNIMFKESRYNFYQNYTALSNNFKSRLCITTTKIISVDQYYRLHHYKVYVSISSSSILEESDRSIVNR